jgi:hypothetical protein
VAKTIPPQLGADSFSCPYCGAIAHQTWLKLFASFCEKENRPMALVYENLQKMDLLKIEDEYIRASVGQCHCGIDDSSTEAHKGDV